MNQNIPIIPARYYLRLMDLLNQRNIPIHELLLQAGFQLEHFVNIEDAKLSIQQIELFVEFCLKYPQNSDLAFELGSLLKLSSHSLVGYVVLTSETAKQAIYLVAQYFKLIIPNFRLTIKEDSQHVFLSFEPTMSMSRLNLNFHIEAIAIAFYHNLAELLNQQFPYYQVYLSIDEPRHIQKYAKLNNVKFNFQYLPSAGIQIVLPIEILQSQLPMADAFSLKVVEQRCQDLIKQISDSGKVETWIRMMLHEAYHVPTLHECAKLLNISTKTLQRYLKKQHSDFHIIRMQVIMERAQYMLINTEKTVTEIADELGYSTSANFTRTFKDQIKMTPIQYRQINK